VAEGTKYHCQGGYVGPCAFCKYSQQTSCADSLGRPLNRFIPRRDFNKCLKVINEFVNPYIEQALRLSPAELESKSKSESSYTFLHALASFTRDRKVLRDQFVAVLLAGRVCLPIIRIL
jgi:hypothetical protein